MLKVGLTGGIGSGKSVVADFFAELGVSVIDADVIARNLVKPGLPATDAIIETFGTDVLQADGGLDRGKLRKMVFDDAGQRKKLESILHPLVRSKIRDEISQARGCYCLVVIPLMIETGQTDLVDQLVVVDAPVELQIKRTVQRDGVSAQDVEAIIRAQADRQARCSAGDFVIVNDGSIMALKQAVAQLHAEFCH